MDAHALVIGIADYLNITRLPGIVRQDARDIRDLWWTRSAAGTPDRQLDHGPGLV